MYKLFWPGFYHFRQRLCARYKPQRVGITLASEVGLWLKTILHHMWELCHLASSGQTQHSLIHLQDLLLGLISNFGWLEMYVQQADIAEDQQWVKEILSLLKDEPFRVVYICGRLVTTTQWQSARARTTHQMEMNWNDSTSYRPEFRSLENSWLILLELSCACLPCTVRSTVTWNSERSIGPGDSLLISSALVDTGVTQNHGWSTVHHESTRDGGDSPEEAPQRKALTHRDLRPGDWELMFRC